MSDFNDEGGALSQRMNLAQHCIGRSARRFPDKVALIEATSQASLTYRELEVAVLRAARILRESRRDWPAAPHVLIRLRSDIAYPLSFFGAVAAGLIPVPASPDLTEREIGALIEDAEPAAVVLDDSLPHGALPAGVISIPKEKIAQALRSGPLHGYEQADPNAPAFMIYTSGATATPKGVLHAHRSIIGRRPMYEGWYGIGPDDRVLHAGSFNWTYTLGAGLMDPWANGATAVVYSGEKTPAIWPRLIRENAITIFAAVPGVFRQMLKYTDVSRKTIPTLRHGLCAGEALPQTVADEWRERTGTVLYEALGQSELSTYISTCPSAPPKPGAVGKAQRGRKVVILPEEGGVEPLPPGEPGLIAVHRSDPGLMLGYWRRPEEEAQMFRGDWFIGGDAGVMDEEGYIAHLGRHNELMNAGGFRVSPLEIEQQLARHPGVSEAAVAEIPISDGVSIIAAFIVPRAGASLQAADLRQFAQTCLAAYKQPKQYTVVEELPRTPNGKVKRAELKLLLQRERN